MTEFAKMSIKLSGSWLVASLRRLLWRTLSAALIVFSSPAFADNIASPEETKLASGDRIVVTVFGQPELSGDLLINGEGSVSLPFVGAIVVTNMTLLECEKAIADRLADGILVKPAVNVRIAELRPIYIFGDVRTSGSYPFRYGGTVKSAIAAAGGYGHADTMQGNAASEFLLADERVRQLNLQNLTLLVRRSRLEAQRDGAQKFTPPTFPDVTQQRDVADVVAAETEAFETQAAVMKAQLDQMRSQKPRLTDEIQAVESQIPITEQQVEFIRKGEDQYSGLIKQGLGLTNSVMQLKLEEFSRQSDILKLQAEVARLRMDAGELDIKIQDTEAAFKKQIIAELLDTQQRLKDIEISAESARALRLLRLRQIKAPSSDVERKFVVTRVQNGKETALTATEATAIAPGDIIEVKSEPVEDLVGSSGAIFGDREAKVVSQ
jgi:polysaccharide export outer membrane protein